MVEYTYDAWGEVLSVTGSMADTVGAINPMRYRGYYLDNETGYYYLQNRYYDPQICRFINADEPNLILQALETENTVWLKYNLHRRLHTNTYYSSVNVIITAAYSRGRTYWVRRSYFITALIAIKSMLTLANKGF